MKKNSILKYLKYFSVGFIIVLAVEVIDIALFSSIIDLNLGIYNLNIITIIFISGFTSLEVLIEWLILFTIICAFLILGTIMLILSFKKNIEEKLLIKFILLIGLFFLISGLIKTFIIYLLGMSTIQYNSTSITVQNAIYTESITPFIGVIMWIYFWAVSMVILTSGLILGGVGLKSLLNNEGRK
ncbi:MAG: hypothetical protein ACFFEO_17785 [Candidatus Thorarchaeota archaeon]